MPASKTLLIACSRLLALHIRASNTPLIEVACIVAYRAVGRPHVGLLMALGYASGFAAFAILTFYVVSAAEGLLWEQGESFT